MAIGEAVIGRIVHAGGTVLFESAPLCVPPDVAHAVVAEAPTAWIDALAEGCRSECGEVLGEFIAKMHHFDLLCDLPAMVRRQLVQPLDPSVRPDRVGTGGNGCEYDTALVLAALGSELAVVEEPLDEAGAQLDEHRPLTPLTPLTPLVAAAFLEPGTVEALAPLLVASDAPLLRDWANLIPTPADIRCRRLADGLAAVA